MLLDQPAARARANTRPCSRCGLVRELIAAECVHAPPPGTPLAVRLLLRAGRALQPRGQRLQLRLQQAADRRCPERRAEDGLLGPSRARLQPDRLPTRPGVDALPPRAAQPLPARPTVRTAGQAGGIGA